MSYTITVTRTAYKTVKGGNEWAVIDKDENGKEKRGYTPEYETSKEFEMEVLKQTVDDIDIKVLLLAINGIWPSIKTTFSLLEPRDYADDLAKEGEG